MNGTLVSSKAATGNILVSNGMLRLGGNLIWGEYFSGTIDEVRIYNGELTQAQIQTDMNTAIPTPPTDTTPPTVSITSPVNGSTASASISINATASDNVGVAGVQFTLDGANLGLEDSTNPYRISWDTTTATNTVHRLTAVARDAARNTTTSSVVSVNVYNPPRLNITQPANNATIAGTTINVSYVMVGDLTGVDGVHLILDNGPELSDSDLDGSYSFFDVPPGAHALNGFLVDHSGAKISGSDAARVNLTTQVSDTTPPSVSITNPGNASTVSGTINVTADATDNVGISGVQFTLDGADLGARDTTAPYAVAWNTNASSNGTHSLVATAYDTSTNQSTSSAVNVTVSNTDPRSQVGEWAPTMDWPVVAVNAALTYTGDVLVWDGYDGPTSQARLWNPVTGTMTLVPAPSDMFCSGESQLPDGNILVTGGHAGGEIGTVNANIFDPAAKAWTPARNMATARWYPSNIPLADGRTIALGGQITSGVFADTPEIYDPKTNTWANMPVNTSTIHDHEYILTNLLPNGRIFSLGASPGVTAMFDPAVPSWTSAPNDPNLMLASSVMYRPGKILVSGGGNKNLSLNAQTSALVLDETQANPAWRHVNSMVYPRYQHNLVMLPDGKVIAVGGSTILDQSSHSGSLAAEIWDPVSETWSTMASMRDPRMYHSTAVLLPDARVLSAGGGRESTGTNYLTAQVYSPPYLFKGARPTITDVPAAADYAAGITVTTPNAADISMVSLVSLSATTHTLDASQHFSDLSFTKNAYDLTVTMPSDGNVAPPGYYMLFVVNNAGVPSQAAMVRLHDTQAPTAPTNLVVVTPNAADLSWTAATDNVGVAKYNIHRSTVSGFTPSAANQIGQSQTTTYNDTNASGTVYYKVTAQDLAGNVSAASNEVTTTVPAGPNPPVTIDFNNFPTPNNNLNGQYPAGVVDWGTNVWYVAGPWRQFTTNSISYNRAGITSGSFNFVSPKRLLSVRAFNGGTVASTLTFSCAGNATKTVSIAVNQLLTIQTGWTANCTTVTFTSTNGWDTNLDDLVYDQVP